MLYVSLMATDAYWTIGLDGLCGADRVVFGRFVGQKGLCVHGGAAWTGGRRAEACIAVSVVTYRLL